MKAYANPPVKVIKVMTIVLQMFKKYNVKGLKTEKEKNGHVWKESTKSMADP